MIKININHGIKYVVQNESWSSEMNKIGGTNKHAMYYEKCVYVWMMDVVWRFFFSGIRGVGQGNSMRNREEDSQYGNIIDDLR